MGNVRDVFPYGDDSFADMISRKYVTSVFTGFGGTQCGGFAALSYLLSEHNRDRAVEAFIRKRLTDRAERMLIAIKESGYRTARSAGGGYCYGSNADVLSDCMDFITAYLISGDQRYLSGATDQFSYIFGQNPMDIMYMTGAGEEYCRFPSHKLSISSNSDSPLPGMIVSGANGERGDEYSKWHIEKGMPPQSAISITSTAFQPMNLRCISRHRLYLFPPFMIRSEEAPFRGLGSRADKNKRTFGYFIRKSVFYLSAYLF